MEEFKGDKRSKAYRAYKAKFKEQQENESKGLGDTIAKITKATGIEKVVKAVVGEDCGCDERKETLNKLFKYTNVECLTEDEYNKLDKYFARNTSTVDYLTQKNLLKIYNRVFSKNKMTSNCSSCVRRMVRDLRNVYENN
jgi:hypothetical protein|tara:strand:+ start:136 stop:555 length:420 start_codon:yes stop_codon:yes gene_type:complete